MYYQIIGENCPAILLELDPGEGIYCELDAMSWMDPTIKMQTRFGGFFRFLSRKLTGKTAFQNYYEARNVPGEIALSLSFPGEIKIIDLEENESVIVRNESFFACSRSVTASVYINQRLSSSIIGGENFIMQRFTGPGVLFLKVAGSAITYDLEYDEEKLVDTGHFVMMEESCNMSVKMIQGASNWIFGREGLWNTGIKGPGRIMVQSAVYPKLR